MEVLLGPYWSDTMFYIQQSTKFPSCRTENILQRKCPHWKTSVNLTCFLKEIVTFIENNYPLKNNLSNSFMCINRVSCSDRFKRSHYKKPVFYSCVFLGFGLHLLTPHCVLVAFTETQWIRLQKEESGKQSYEWLALLKTLTLSTLRLLCSLLLKLKPWLLRPVATHHVWVEIQLTIILNKGGDECVHGDRAQVKYDRKPYISGSACMFLLSAGEQKNYTEQLQMLDTCWNSDAWEDVCQDHPGLSSGSARLFSAASFWDQVV